LTKVFITGVSGFIGCELAHRCVEEGYTVAGLIRQHPQHNEAVESLKGKILLYEGDLRDSTRLSNIIREFNPEYVAHLGALTRVSYSFSHEEETMDVNLGGTVRLVNALKKYGTNLKKFIFASSMETYGHQEKHEPFDENTPFGVGSPYGVWKIACDYYLRQQWYANRFPCIILRQTNTYGRKYDNYFVVEAFITDMLRNPDVVNFGDPRPVRNFIYIDDLIDLYITLFESDNPELFGKAFTIGPPNGISIKELADLIAKKLNWNGRINWFTREIRSGEIFYLNSKHDLITELTGWKPKVSLDEGLDRTITYWKKKLGIKR